MRDDPAFSKTRKMLMAARPTSSVSSTPHGEAFATVALQALRTIASQRSARAKGIAAETSPEALALFARLMFAKDYIGGDSVVEKMTGAGAHPEQVLDFLIPKMAEKIGHGWMQDDLSFAHVTIVSARLQNLAWLYIEPFRDAADQIPAAPRVLVAVAEGETHALGGVIAVGGFSRLGCQVITAIGASDEVILRKATAPDLGMISISASASGDMRKVGELIAQLKRRKGCPPIAVGGSVIGDNRSLAEALGADIVTNDVTEALALTIGRKLFNNPVEFAPEASEKTKMTDG